MSNFKKCSEEYKADYGDIVVTFTIEQKDGDFPEVTVMIMDKEEHNWKTLINAESLERFENITNAFDSIQRKLESMKNPQNNKLEVES